MTRSTPLIAFALAALAACGSPSPTPVTTQSAFLSLVNGKTLASPTAAITLTADGGMTVSLPNRADLIRGTWTWVGSEFCRTLAPGTGVEDTACQDVSVLGDVLTFDGPDGARSYTIR